MAQSVLGKINYLTEEQYQDAKANGQIHEDEIYLTPDKTKTQDVRLFYDANGYMSNIQLGVNKSQFEKLRIIYASNGSDYRCAEIPTVSSNFCLYGVDNNGNGTAAWMKKTTYALTENAITIQNSFWKNVNGNEYGTDNCIKIIEVLGVSSSDHIKSFETAPDIYSTAETIIGEYLGKPLYRKVLNMTLTGQNTRYNHNISNFGSIIKAYGKLHRSDGLQQLIPANYSNWEIWLYDINGTSFSLRFSNNQWNSGISNCQIILEYTKTTD